MKKWIPYLFCALAIMLFSPLYANDASNQTAQQATASKEVSTLVSILENPKSLDKLIKELKDAQKEKQDSYKENPIPPLKKAPEEDPPLQDIIYTINQSIDRTTKDILSHVPDLLRFPKDFVQAAGQLVKNPKLVGTFFSAVLIYGFFLLLITFFVNHFIVNRFFTPRALFKKFFTRSLCLFLSIYILNRIFMNTYYANELSIITPVTQLSQFGLLAFVALYFPFVALQYGKKYLKHQQTLKKASATFISFFIGYFGIIELFKLLGLEAASVDIFRKSLFLFLSGFLIYCFHKTKHCLSLIINTKLDEHRTRISTFFYVLIKSFARPTNIFVILTLTMCVMFINYGDIKETLFALFLINVSAILNYLALQQFSSWQARHKKESENWIHRVVFGLKMLVVFLFIMIFLYLLGFNSIEFFKKPSTKYFFSKVLSVGIIIVVLRFAWHLTKSFLDSLRQQSSDDDNYKIERFHPFIKNILGGIYLIIGVVLVAAEFGYYLTPLLLSFSALGISISLAAQNVIKDIINGALIMTENNLKVGDIVEIGSPMVLGEVEKITLRTVYIRHGVGPLETVPFSSITRVVNRSQSYNYAVITCGVPHGSDLKCVYQALRDTSDELLKETDLTIRPLEPVVIRGISEVTDTMIRIAASIKTTQDPKNFFEREFNYRLKKNLDRLGIHQPAVRNVIEILSPLSPESIPSVLPPNKS